MFQLKVQKFRKILKIYSNKFNRIMMLNSGALYLKFNIIKKNLAKNIIFFELFIIK